MIRTTTLFLLSLAVSVSASADFWDEEEDTEPVRRPAKVQEPVKVAPAPVKRTLVPVKEAPAPVKHTPVSAPRRAVKSIAPVKAKIVQPKPKPKPMALPVDKTIQLRAPVNNPTIDKNLRVSLQSNYMKEVERWYKSGASVNARDSRGRTLLYLAIQRHHLVGIEYLLHHRANVNLSNEDGGTPLGIAVTTGQYKVVQYLLERGAGLAPLPDGDSMEHYAIKRGYNHIALELIKKGVDVTRTYKDRMTLLHVATRRGLPQITQALLEAGANPNARNAEGATVLHEAAALGRVQIVNQLLSNKADPIAQTPKHWLPLHHAARFGHYSIVRTLLSQAPKSVNNRTSSGKSPLDLARQLAHNNVIDYLTPRTRINRQVARTRKTRTAPARSRSTAGSTAAQPRRRWWFW